MAPLQYSSFGHAKIDPMLQAVDHLVGPLVGMFFEKIAHDSPGNEHITPALVLGSEMSLEVIGGIVRATDASLIAGSVDTSRHGTGEPSLVRVATLDVALEVLAAVEAEAAGFAGNTKMLAAVGFGRAESFFRDPGEACFRIAFDTESFALQLAVDVVVGCVLIEGLAVA